MNFFIAKFNFWVSIVLLMIGLYGMIAKECLMKKVIGMAIFSTSIILFYVSLGAKAKATIPILDHHTLDAHHAVHAAGYVNPTPHVLMLTAIVVGVATVGVALAIIEKIYEEYGTKHEDEIRRQLRE